MKLAFCLFKYFPYGGLQRDFLRIAKVCAARGHEVHVYTQSWQGEVDPQLIVHLISVNNWQNHTRSQAFAEKLKPIFAKEKFDVVVGFNKMPYLDVYYAADVCYYTRAHEERSRWYRLLPRYRHLLALEKAVFAHGNKTHILSISHFQQQEYMRSYQTEEERFHFLTPGIARDRIAPENAADIRSVTRKMHQLSEQDILFLMVGSDFKRKGIDRAMKGMSTLPSALKDRCHFFVVGQDRPDTYLKLANQLQITNQMHFLGGRSDIPELMLAADFLVHPAYSENTGTVLLEAVVAGLPVLTVDACGYASYIEEAKAGIVVKTPFQQEEFNRALEKMILSMDERLEWQQNAIRFAKTTDLYSLPEKAANFIELTGNKRAPLFT